MPVFEVKGETSEGRLERRRFTARTAEAALREARCAEFKPLSVLRIGPVRTVGDLPVDEFKAIVLGMCMLALLIWAGVGLLITVLLAIAR